MSDEGPVSGPLLFGRFSIADAFYAPLVMRLRTYALPGVRGWIDGALAEKGFRDFEEPHRLSASMQSP